MSKITEWQKEAIKNKKRKGFPIKSVEQEFLLMHNEMSEAYKSYDAKEQQNLGEELADIAIYLMGISDYLGYDLGDEIAHKLAKNSKRKYHFDSEGKVISKDENAVN